MPFLAQQHVDIPSQHLVSWVFDGPVAYDENLPIYVDANEPSRSISKAQARKIVRQLVAGFHAAGLQPGETVVLASNNDIMYSMIFLGVIAAGGVISTTNPNYMHLELVHQLKTVGASFILAEPSLLDRVLKAADEAGVSRGNIYAFDPKTSKSHGFKSWKDLLSHGEKDWQGFNDNPKRSDETAALLFSSGTTGLPKAAQLSHKNFIAEHTLVYERSNRPTPNRRIVSLPMFHVAMAPSTHVSPIRSGDQTFVQATFNVKAYLWAIERYQITDLGAVPPVIIAMLNSPDLKKDTLKSVKRMGCGAAPLPEQPQAQMQSYLPDDAPLTQVYGMTESTCIAFRFEYPEADTTASIGYPLPNIDVKLVDDDGNDITDYGVRGELCMRGPIVIKGYLNNANKDWDSDGYFHTGDVALCDKETKKWYVVDRKKELIKVRAFQVAPPELEGVLLGHPDVSDAAVIGVPLKDSGYPRAYLVKKTGSKVTEDEIRKYIADRLIYYKRLEGGVVFVDAIPKNPSGKILKRVLRDQAAREMESKL